MLLSHSFAHHFLDIWTINSAFNLLMSWTRVGRIRSKYIIWHSDMSNLKASLDDFLMPSMHYMEFAFYKLRSSSLLNLSNASSASSSLTSIRVLGWEVPSLKGSGYKEVSPS